MPASGYLVPPHPRGRGRLGGLAGLIPSCWVGNDGCCVFGVDDRSGRSAGYRGDRPLEVQSPALPEQQKAWWVPPAAIRGAWHAGVFFDAVELRRRGGPLLNPKRLVRLRARFLVVAEEFAAWRQHRARRLRAAVVANRGFV